MPGAEMRSRKQLHSTIALGAVTEMLLAVVVLIPMTALTVVNKADVFAEA